MLTQVPAHCFKFQWKFASCRVIEETCLNTLTPTQPKDHLNIDLRMGAFLISYTLTHSSGCLFYANKNFRSLVNNWHLGSPLQSRTSPEVLCTFLRHYQFDVFITLEVSCTFMLLHWLKTVTLYTSIVLMHRKNEKSDIFHLCWDLKFFSMSPICFMIKYS